MEQAKEKSSRRRRSIQQIEDLLAEFEKSALSVKDFCSHHSISTANFYKWKSRYRRGTDNNSKTSAFAAFEVVSSLQHVSLGLFAEVGHIKIYQPVSASFLNELLK